MTNTRAAYEVSNGHLFCARCFEELVLRDDPNATPAEIAEQAAQCLVTPTPVNWWACEGCGWNLVPIRMRW